MLTVKALNAVTDLHDVFSCDAVSGYGTYVMIEIYNADEFSELLLPLCNYDGCTENLAPREKRYKAIYVMNEAGKTVETYRYIHDAPISGLDTEQQGQQAVWPPS